MGFPALRCTRGAVGWGGCLSSTVPTGSRVPPLPRGKRNDGGRRKEGRWGDQREREGERKTERDGGRESGKL